jgi:RND superfamily putative drug exporter
MAVQAAVERHVRDDAVFVQILTSEVGDTAVARDIVRDLRGISVAGVEAEVGGSTASSVDTIDAIRSATPSAVLFVLIGSYVILLLVFGSLLLPLKAIVMTLLSISASLGSLVFIFQDGRFADLLGYTATGTVISTTPILMFCILFGLSMDYEVLMLSRIQEEYQLTGNNTASIALGLERTASVITGAAAVMVVVFAAFMTASIVIIQSLGFGLALAVLIDATIVRGLLVPATMRLMGRWNWWAPSPVKSVVDRFGFSHVESPTPANGD